MKKKLLVVTTLIISVLLINSWKAGAQSTSEFVDNLGAVITPQPIVQEMIDQVSQSRILTTLRRFTGVEELCIGLDCGLITTRFTESAGLSRVKSYTYWTLRNMHYSVEALDWTRNGYSDQNILAHKRGLIYPDEEIYFIAHLDGVPNPGPAADDDGSGSAALLELARILSTRYFSRSVTLFFSSGEEQGSYGSHQFVDDYPERLGSIKYLVSLDMLGYDSNDDGWMELWSGDNNTDFQQFLSEIIIAYPIDLVPQIVPGCT